jgi:outer membrane protein TolC
MKNRITQLCASTALLLLPVTVSAANQPTEIDQRSPELEAILNSAQRKAPDLIKQEFIKTETDARLKQAKAAYYPSLQLTTNLGYRKDYREDDAENTDNFGLTYSAALRRPLYHWGAIEAKIEQARITNDSDALNYLKNLQQIERRIRADYLTLILNNIALRNEQAKQAILEARSETNRINFEAGKLSELAYQQSRIALDMSLLQIERIAQSQQRIAERFQYYAGWEAPTTQSTEIPDFDLAAMADWLQQQHEQIASSSWIYQTHSAEIHSNEIAHQQEAITQIKAQQRPLIDASLTASQNQSNTSNRNNVDTFSVFGGIRVSWNIFDGFRTRNQIIEAQSKLRRLEHELRKLSQELKLEASEVLDALLFQVRSLQLTETQHATKQAEYALKEDSARNGRITQLELQDAALSLEDETFKLHQARANLHIGLSDYLDLVSPIR